MRIINGLAKSSSVYTVNCRSRLVSVLRVAFEDATLTQGAFYRVLKLDAICVHVRVTCAYVHFALRPKKENCLIGVT